MWLFTRLSYCLIFIVATFFFGVASAAPSVSIPILCYHNFNPTKPGSMNLTPQKVEAQFKWLKDNGYTIIPLKEAVLYLQGQRTSLPPKPIVITVDDGWQSAYTYLYPIVRKLQIPVTLFIYPETISNGKHSMTWDELTELQATGLFDIQGHTYSHPNFKQEKRRLSPAAYDKVVETELVRSKKILEDHLHHPITLLAWPFGIYDSYLEKSAEQAGYTMAFTIDARTANRSYRPMAQPRYMIVEGQSMQTFMTIARSAKSN